MAKYVLTNKAVEDLSNIWNYTYEIWSENQADLYYELIISTCQELAQSPEKGKSFQEIAEEITGFRVGKHIIFFRQISSHEIEILRILHGSMDLKNRIRG